MQVIGIKTHYVQPGASMTELLDGYLTDLQENTVVAITSKIISISEQRLIPKHTVDDKFALIQQEADAYLEKTIHVSGAYLTIKHNRLIPSAGIDESNVAQSYLLYPKNSQETAEYIWHYLRHKHQIQQLGVLITDSAVAPLRVGVTGIGIAWCGFAPLYDYVGKPDLVSQPLRMTKINMLDALAAAAVLIMGEGAEQTPIAMISQVPKINFQNRVPTEAEKKSIVIEMEHDLFAPLLKNAAWIWPHPKFGS